MPHDGLTHDHKQLSEQALLLQHSLHFPSKGSVLWEAILARAAQCNPAALPIGTQSPRSSGLKAEVQTHLISDELGVARALVAGGALGIGPRLLGLQQN